MDLVRLGTRLRAIRIARRERIVDVAARSGLSKSAISRHERGDSWRTPLAALERHAAALGATLDVSVGYRGSDLDRLVNAAHSALHEAVARLFQRLSGWIAVPEVSFSVFGERGAIDWLAWHPATRSLLVIEIKTALVDIGAVLAALDRYARLAPQIARERGWDPLTVSVWLVFEDSSRNRRAVASHSALLGGVFAADGHAMRVWLGRPNGAIRALSFLSNSHAMTPRPRIVRTRNAVRPAASVARDQSRHSTAGSAATGSPGGNAAEGP